MVIGGMVDDREQGEMEYIGACSPLFSNKVKVKGYSGNSSLPRKKKKKKINSAN